MLAYVEISFSDKFLTPIRFPGLRLIHVNYHIFVCIRNSKGQICVINNKFDRIDFKGPKI